MTNETVKRGEAATSLRYKMMELASSMDDVISLGRGDPDLGTPADVWTGALRKLQDRHSSSPVRGLPELREAITARYEKEKGLGGLLELIPIGEQGLFCPGNRRT